MMFFKKYPLVVILVSGCQLAFSQVVIEGKVLDKKTGNPMAYANIGVFNKNVGTLSNGDGTFLIRIPSETISDTLQISSVGYRTLRIPIPTFSANEKVVLTLEEQAIQLSPITFSHVKEDNRTFELGNDRFNGGVLETDTAFAGKSIALLIDGRLAVDHPDLTFPVYIASARLRILKNNLSVLKFRVRINAIDTVTGLPGDDILRESVIAKSTMRKGWLEFDLLSKNLIVAEPFFLTFEQILDQNDRSSIASGFEKFRTEHPDKIRIDTVDFEGSEIVQRLSGPIALDLPGTFISISSKVGEQFKCYERETSFGEWKRVQGIVAAMVTLSNQKPTKKFRKRK